MTRESAKAKLMEANSGSDAFNKGVKQANSRANRIFKEIYDHFEQQQLENLAHLQMANELIEKLKKEQLTLENTICKWERKDIGKGYSNYISGCRIESGSLQIGWDFCPYCSGSIERC